MFISLSKLLIAALTVSNTYADGGQHAGGHSEGGAPAAGAPAPRNGEGAPPPAAEGGAPPPPPAAEGGAPGGAAPATGGAPPPAGATRPESTSMCDFYTQAVFGQNNEANQLKLLTTVVNRVVGGNFTATPDGVPVTGILAKTNFNGEAIDLLPIFTGQAGPVINEGGTPAAVNFLDGGGAEPLKEGKASNNPASRQESLLNHLYQLFGSLLKCGAQGGQVFPKYTGKTSMFEVHRFMNLNKNQLDFFNDQVGKSAVSLGVSVADATAVGKALTDLFVNKCSKPVPLTPESPAEFQGSCLANGCPVIDAAQCPPGFTPDGVQGGQGAQPQGGQQGGQNGGVQNGGNGRGEVRRVLKCTIRQGGGGRGSGGHQGGGGGYQGGHGGNRGSYGGNRGGYGHK